MSYHFFFLYFYHCFIISTPSSSSKSNNSSQPFGFLIGILISLPSICTHVLSRYTTFVLGLLLLRVVFFSPFFLSSALLRVCSFSSCIFVFFIHRRRRLRRHLAVLMNHFFNVYRCLWIKTWRYLNEDVCKRFCACAFTLCYRLACARYRMYYIQLVYIYCRLEHFL